MSSEEKNGVAENVAKTKNDDDAKNEKGEVKSKTNVSRITWQRKEDRDDRIQMIHQIVRLLRTKKPNAPASWLKKLPVILFFLRSTHVDSARKHTHTQDMARRLEDTLYRHAISKEEYMNTKTLKLRLQDVARQMGARVKRKQAQEQMKNTSSSSSSSAKATSAPPAKRMKKEVKKEEVTTSTRDSSNSSGSGSTEEGTQKRMIVDLGAINSAAVAPVKKEEKSSNGATENKAAAQTKLPSGMTQEEFEKRKRRAHLLRQQQQRLLLLRHASKCQAENCTQTKLCPQMKWLWKHIAKCKDKQCQVSHCVSSRYVLTHYHQCKDKKCQVCAPVRLMFERGVRARSARIQDDSTFLSRITRNSLEHQHSNATLKYNTQIQHSNSNTNQHSNIQVRQAIHLQQRKRRMIEEQRRKPKKRKLTKEEKEKRRKRMANVIHSLNKDQLKSLFGSLRTEFNPFWNAQRMKTTFKPLIKKITDLEWGWIFSEPVDPDKLQLKDYFKIIKRPMDLGTVRRNLDKGMYKVPKLMYHDIKLTFDNAMLFNPEGSDVHAIAKEYMQKFKEGFSEVMTQMIEQEKIARSRKDACTMCGGERFTFEPPVFYCNGRCHKRIGRNRFYYTTPENKFHYCQSCYQTMLKPQFELNGQTVNKKDLIKKKNNDTKQESWVRGLSLSLNLTSRIFEHQH